MAKISREIIVVSQNPFIGEICIMSFKWFRFLVKLQNIYLAYMDFPFISFSRIE